MDAHRKSIRYILYGQAGFILAMLLCFIIKPHHQGHNSSLSYYGNFRVTIVPYAAGIIIAAYSLFKTAKTIAKIKNLKYVRKTLQIAGAALILILVTPFAAGKYFFYGHILASLMLVLANFYLVFYCIFKIAQNWQSYLLVLINLLSIVGCVLSLAEIHILHYEAIFEFVALASLSLIFVNTLTIHSLKQAVKGKI